MFGASCTCVLFISVMYSVNEAQIFKYYFALILFTATPLTAVFGTAIVPLTSMYASL